MIPNPILKVLSSMRTNGVRCLLMGGQACVLYGAAEFSRDTDLAVLSDQSNLDRLAQAFIELRADRIAVPPFEKRYLDSGLSVHFRCQHPDAAGLRVDLLARMRGVAPFDDLWQRRTSVEWQGESLDVLALPDLVLAKKTQRDKDWPMVARLVSSNYIQHASSPTAEQIHFWLRELRSPDLLIEAAQRFRAEANALLDIRPLLSVALASEGSRLEMELRAEEERERAADREYWKPLRQELERLRHSIRHPRIDSETET